jgi:hypothetical protein
MIFRDKNNTKKVFFPFQLFLKIGKVVVKIPLKKEFEKINK